MIDMNMAMAVYAADRLENEGYDELADYVMQLKREHDALIADLTTVCETVNTCLACDHYRPEWVKPGCELNGLHCAWKWRGVQEEKEA
jgi:glutamate/tyrosine decarboxylase-like PLP-dependent enzyme